MEFLKKFRMNVFQILEFGLEIFEMLQKSLVLRYEIVSEKLLSIISQSF